MTIPPPIRPTFTHDLPMTAEEVVAALRRAFEAERGYPWQSRGPHVVVTVPPGERRFWSPYLTIEATPVGAGVRIHGRFSPKPTIWTGFMLSYIALITAGCFGLMFGVSMQIVDRPGTLAYILALLFLLAALGLYLASQVGQRLAQDQMEGLHALVRGAVGVDPAATPARGAGGARSDSSGRVAADRPESN